VTIHTKWTTIETSLRHFAASVLGFCFFLYKPLILGHYCWLGLNV